MFPNRVLGLLVWASGVILGVAGVAMGPLPASAESDFERFMQEERAAFETFAEEFREDFAAYQEAFEEELAAYQEELRANWRDPATGDGHRWVFYSEDQQSRTRVDFEAETITIEVPEAEGDEGLNHALVRLEDLLQMTHREAYQADEVTQRAESRVDLDEGRRDVPADQRVLSEIDSDQLPEMLEQAEVEQQTEPSASPAQEERNMVILSVPLPESRTSDKAREYQPMVERYAREHGVDAALMLAIMHSESSFNPMARSHIPAYGLMQIVPESAGIDVAQQLYGEPRRFSPGYLYDPENNIRAGAVYLAILEQRYLSPIKDPETRRYATIAAYNTGAGNVARTFTDSTNISRAASVINDLSASEAFAIMVKELPYQETRDYLPKVTGRHAVYRDF